MTILFPRRRDIATPEAMHEFGRALAGELRAGDVVVLTGELGAGKTTFTRGLGEGLGVRGAVTSPTFVLARTHPSVSGGPDLVHVDAYRLNSALELDDLDIDFPSAVVVIEWGAGLVDELTDSYLSITLDRPRGGGAGGGGLRDGATSVGPVDSDDSDEFDPSIEPIESRRVTIESVGPRWSWLRTDEPIDGVQGDSGLSAGYAG